MLMGRNKSLDEGVYGDRWRKSLTAYETSQSTESIDLSPVEHHKSNSCAKSDITFFNGLDSDDLKSKSKSQHVGLDSKYISVAHIKLRDAKSEQNVCPLGLSQGESSDDLDRIDETIKSPQKSTNQTTPDVVDVHSMNSRNSQVRNQALLNS